MTTVSIIVPCYNEEQTIELLLAAIYAQTYPRENMEVIIADGLSTDGTRAVIAEYQGSHQDLRIKLVDNTKKTIPSGLNRAIQASSGDIIVRLDAHSAPRPEYVARCIENLRNGLGENVGGVWEIHPGGQGWMASSIAVAAAHPLGVGDAKYRYSDSAGAVDTVPFGAFKRELIDEIGGFDERLLANEDYEFNARVRAKGGKIWLDPKVRSIYFARTTLHALAKQYWRYGYWKMRMLRRYPKTVRWRQGLPPIFVVSIIILGILSISSALAGWILGLQVVLYALALLGAAAQLAVKRRSIWLIIGVPLAIATMHIFWGGAFLWSMASSLSGRKK